MCRRRSSCIRVYRTALDAIPMGGHAESSVIGRSHRLGMSPEELVYGRRVFLAGVQVRRRHRARAGPPIARRPVRGHRRQARAGLEPGSGSRWRSRQTTARPCSACSPTARRSSRSSVPSCSRSTSETWAAGTRGLMRDGRSVGRSQARPGLAPRARGAGWVPGQGRGAGQPAWRRASRRQPRPRTGLISSLEVCRPGEPVTPLRTARRLEAGHDHRRAGGPMSTPERQQDPGEHGYGGVQQEKEHRGPGASAGRPGGRSAAGRRTGRTRTNGTDDG